MEGNVKDFSEAIFLFGVPLFLYATAFLALADNYFRDKIPHKREVKKKMVKTKK